jgi:hypothetical protein
MKCMFLKFIQMRILALEVQDIPVISRRPSYYGDGAECTLGNWKNIYPKKEIF